MKNLFVVISVLALFVSCKKSDVKVDISYTSSLTSTFTMPKLTDQEKSVPDSLVSFTTPSMTNTVLDELKNHSIDLDHLKSISIQGIQLAIQSPSTQNFSFLKTIKVYLGATGVGETLIGSKDNINTISPAPATLDLSVANADVTAYLKSATYYLKVETTLVKTYTQDIDVLSTIQYKVVASPL